MGRAVLTWPATGNRACLPACLFGMEGDGDVQKADEGLQVAGTDGNIGDGNIGDGETPLLLDDTSALPDMSMNLDGSLDMGSLDMGMGGALPDMSMGMGGSLPSMSMGMGMGLSDMGLSDMGLSSMGSFGAGGAGMFSDGKFMGTLRRHFPEKGFGFIKPDDGGDDIFVHVQDNPGLWGCSQGERVTYDAIYDTTKDNYKAANCETTGEEVKPSQLGPNRTNRGKGGNPFGGGKGNMGKSFLSGVGGMNSW
eukprot:TRINITY_DN2333_c1_g2_i2.p1 TRINITY_DN2333_c1_g2~~TRINITY_DN2333_c1_g2_i2.p1  ORF type:complete len:260 (-),score=42.44 TRINITY_DN2333_c1_g2_i2:221-973(-)